MRTEPEALSANGSGIVGFPRLATLYQLCFTTIRAALTVILSCQEDEENPLVEAENGHVATKGAEVVDESKPSQGGPKFGWIKGVLVSSSSMVSFYKN